MIISRWGRRTPENMARVLQLCIISQRRRFFNIPAAMEECVTGGPEIMGVLYGWRLRAFEEIWEARGAIFWHCEDIWNTGARKREKADFLLAHLAGLYGLNVAKAGFACQLLYGVSGCLDSVNMERFGLPSGFCKGFSALRTPRGRRRRVSRYNGMVYKLGGTEYLWNSWCEIISVKYPTQFPTAYAASGHHVACLQPATFEVIA